MGWATTYNLHLSKPIKNWNEEWVTKRCEKEVESLQGIYYMAYQYQDPYNINVNIKYGKCEIISVANIIFEKYKVGIKIEIEDTDYDKFSYASDIDGTIIGNYEDPSESDDKCIKCSERMVENLTCEDTRRWVIVRTYYKHAEYDLQIIKSEDELREYLVSVLEEYNEEEMSSLTSSQLGSRVKVNFEPAYGPVVPEDLEELIENVEELGNRMVEGERGWGIREIREI